MKTHNHIELTKAFVKTRLQGAEGGHDWHHTARVYKSALAIAKAENVNTYIVALAALLHDIADAKFHGGDETKGPTIAREFLTDIKVEQEAINAIVLIVEHISFKGGNFEQTYQSPELDVVQDADRLDAMGAIGIARCFNYGGFKNREIYNPAVQPVLDMTKEAYKNTTAPSINHFYEKLLLLKNRMHTKTGKFLAQERHDFMELFLAQFYAEWDGVK